MKTTRTYFSLAASLLFMAGLAACSQDDNLPGTDQSPADDAIRITATVGDFTGEGVETRATINEDTGIGSFENGDEIGVYVLDKDNALLSNGTATYDGAAWNSTLSWNDLPTPTPDAPIQFVAHFPRQTIGADGRLTFAVQTDQSVPGAYHASDLLMAGTKLTAKGNVNLNFRHDMARLKVVLEKGWEASAEEVNEATVVINNVNTEAQFKDYGISIQPPLGSPGSITPKKSGDRGTNTFYALVPYQNVAADGLELAITVGGKTVTHKVAFSNPTLAPGYQRTIVLKLGNTMQGYVTATTWDELKDALAAPGGTESAPVTITLAANIDTPADTDESVTVKGHKVLDGSSNKYTLTRKDVPGGGYPTLFIDNGSKASLSLRNITLANEYPGRTMFYFTGEGSHLALGPAVSATATASGGQYIDIMNGSRLTVDGATFSYTGSDANFGSWISYSKFRYAGSITGNIVLKDFTFGHTNDYIQFNTPEDVLSIQPGISARLRLAPVSSADFIITPTAGSFTDPDVTKLRIDPNSLIDEGWDNGDDYELYLDGNQIKLRLKSQTP